MSKIWFHHWGYIILIFAYLIEIGCVIYTINAIEFVNRSWRKVIKINAVFLDKELSS